MYFEHATMEMEGVSPSPPWALTRYPPLRVPDFDQNSTSTNDETLVPRSSSGNLISGLAGLTNTLEYSSFSEIARKTGLTYDFAANLYDPNLLDPVKYLTTASGLPVSTLQNPFERVTSVTANWYVSEVPKLITQARTDSDISSITISLATQASANSLTMSRASPSLSPYNLTAFLTMGSNMPTTRVSSVGPFLRAWFSATFCVDGIEDETNIEVPLISLTQYNSYIAERNPLTVGAQPILVSGQLWAQFNLPKDNLIVFALDTNLMKVRRNVILIDVDSNVDVDTVSSADFTPFTETGWFNLRRYTRSFLNQEDWVLFNIYAPTTSSQVFPIRLTSSANNREEFMSMPKYDIVDHYTSIIALRVNTTFSNAYITDCARLAIYLRLHIFGAFLRTSGGSYFTLPPSSPIAQLDVAMAFGYSSERAGLQQANIQPVPFELLNLLGYDKTLVDPNAGTVRNHLGTRFSDSYYSASGVNSLPISYIMGYGRSQTVTNFSAVSRTFFTVFPYYMLRVEQDGRTVYYKWEDPMPTDEQVSQPDKPTTSVGDLNTWSLEEMKF